MPNEVVDIVQRPEFLNLLAKSISKDDLTFSFVRGEFLANGSYFILYKAQLDAILLEIQPKVTRISIKQSIRKCLEIYDNINITPFLVILCTDEGTLSVASMLLPNSQKPLRQTLDSSVWAKKCVLISKEGIDFSKNEVDQYIDPLCVLSLYFSKDEKKKQKLRNTGDPTMELIDSFL